MSDSAGGSGGGDGDDDSAMTPMQVAQMTCDEILEEVNEKKFPTDDVSRGMNEDDKGPYQFVFLQECEYMNALLYEMVKGLQETTFPSRSMPGHLTRAWVVEMCTLPTRMYGSQNDTHILS